MRFQLQKLTIYGLLALIVLAGCSLGSTVDDPASDDPQPTPTDFIVLDPSPTDEPTLSPTSTPEPTFTPRPSNDDNNDDDDGIVVPINQPVIPCVPAPVTWPVYTVVSGDTLSNIAVRTGGSVNELASNNCLADPSRISVGQQLRVPRLPLQNEQVGWITFSPAPVVNNGVNLLQSGQTYTLIWTGASMSGLVAVDFVFYSNDTPNYFTIGTDAWLTDGASATWIAPSTINGTVVAIGRRSGTETIRFSADANVYAFHPDMGRYGAVTVDPYVSLEGDIYSVNQGSTATLAWPESPQADITRVEFEMEIASAGSPSWTLIGTDVNLSDGAQVLVTFTPHMTGRVRAVAYRGQAKIAEVLRYITIYHQFIPPAPVVEGNIQFFPVLDTVNGEAVLEIGATVSLVWAEAGNHTMMGAAFYIQRPGESPISLGNDYDTSDGAQYTWLVSEMPPGTIVYAEGQLVSDAHGSVRSYDTPFSTGTASPPPEETPELTAEPGA